MDATLRQLIIDGRASEGEGGGMIKSRETHVSTRASDRLARRVVTAAAAMLVLVGTVALGTGPAAASSRCSSGLDGDDGDAGGVSGWVKITNSHGGSTLIVHFRAYGERIVANRALRGDEGVILFVQGEDPSFMVDGSRANLRYPEGRGAKMAVTNGSVRCAVVDMIT